MTDVVVKATRIKRKLKLILFIGKSLTKAPSDKSAVISDLFPIKQDVNWNTEFELLNVAGLINGDNNQKEGYSAKMYFFDVKGRTLGSQEIKMENVGRKTLRLADYVSSNFKGAATFSIFHPSIVGKIEMAGSYLAERGYCGYEYNNLGVKGYVHGNLDAVALVGNKVKAVGNSGLISRYYTVQHCLRGPAKYEFVFTNPTSRKVKITPRISYSPRKWLAGNSFSINSLGSHTYVLDVKENEKVYVKFKSRLCLSRPVVFRIANDSMDVFHG